MRNSAPFGKGIPHRIIGYSIQVRAGRKSVVIVDDDSDFVEVIRLVLENDDSWEVVDTFDSLESFFANFTSRLIDSESVVPDVTKMQDRPPDLIVMDVFASNKPATTQVPLTGFQVALALRDLGLQFGTLIVTSMHSPSLLSMLQGRHKDGWAYLVKSADLTSSDILHHANKALLL
jgi:CheY-like chemotaxis protein